MKTVMEFTISTTCPIDGETIPIAVTAEPAWFLKVEDLLQTARTIAAAPVTQEEFTQKLASLHPFRSIQTIGTHSGVKITCSA
jgi:hypothetical protein